MITQTYSLDLVPNGKPVVVPVSQYDNDRMLVFKLFDGGVAFDASGVASAVFTGRKPDNYFFMAAMTVSTDNVSVELTTQMTAAAGNTTCEIILYDSEGNQLGTTNFVMQVEKAPVDDSTKISDSDISAILSALSDSQRYANSAETAAEEAASTAESLESLMPASSGNVDDILVRVANGSDWKPNTADKVSYDNTTSELTATKVQGAVDEVAGKIASLQAVVGDMSAADVSYSTSTSGIDANNTQEAIDVLANSRDLRVNVTLDSSTNTYSADHTYAEIKANYNAKGLPYVRYGGACFPLYMINDSSATFVFVNNFPAQFGSLFSVGDVVQISVKASGDVTYFNWGNSSVYARPSSITAITVSANTQTTTYQNAKVLDPAHSTVEILPKPEYTSAQATLFANAKFVPIEHTTGSVKIYATGTAPTSALSVNLRITPR